MTHGLGLEKLLWQASHLHALVEISRARRRATTFIRKPELEISLQPEYPEPAPDDQALSLAAELFQSLALDKSGAAYDDDDPATWDEADAALPEIVSMGHVRFRLIDADAADLAFAIGAVDPDDSEAVCLLVEFDESEDAPTPAIGQVVAVQTDGGVTLTFGVWATHSDFNDRAAPDLGSDAERNEMLAAISDHPGRALLVQVLDTGVA